MSYRVKQGGMVDNIKYSIYNSVMRAVLIFTIQLILFTGHAAADTGGFSVMGVEFPVMIGEGDRWIEPEDTILFASSPIYFDINLYLSDFGTVDSMYIDSVRRVRYIWAIRRSLKCLQFTPARIDGKCTSFVYPMRLLFYTRFSGRRVMYELPYSKLKGKHDRDLIYKALRQNGFEPPALKSFPSYFCYLPKSEAAGDYNYTIFEITLDSAGNPADVKTLLETDSGLSAKVGTAIDFAEFSPAVYNGRHEKSILYLIFRFFNNIVYPTKPWPPTGSSVSNFPFGYIRIEDRLYLDSVVNPSIPLNIPGGLFYYGKGLTLWDTLMVEVTIDTAGAIVSHRLFNNFSNEKLNMELKEFFPYLRFLPARDIDGRPLVFHGKLAINRLSSNNIRIYAKWLSPEAQPQKIK